MNRITRFRPLAATLVAVLAAAAAASCGIEKQEAPALAGPSEFAVSITLTATPDQLTRDGESQSTISAIVRDHNNTPVRGVVLNLTVDPANGGVLSAYQVVTDADGVARVVFTAPTVSTPVDTVSIVATPVGENYSNSTSRIVRLGLGGPTAAVASFLVSPTSPQRFQLTTLDASGTTLNGSACGSNCTYSWALGNEATLTGQVVTYQFQQAQSYAITLTVTAPGGVQSTAQQSIAVTAATLPTAVMTVSPTNPRVGDSVQFNGASSTAANGATIVEYMWDFGDGGTGNGPTQSHVYALARTYVVRLTVRDTNGLTSTVTQNVTVAAP